MLRKGTNGERDQAPARTPADGEEPYDLPLASTAPSLADRSAMDEVAWDRQERRGAGLLYEPLEERRGEAAPPAAGPDPADSSPLLFRLALSTAALLVLLVLARGFWWPEEPPQDAAPEWAAGPNLPAAPATAAPEPNRAEPSEEPLVEPGEQEPTLVEEMATVARESVPAAPSEPRRPEPVIVEEAPPKPVQRRELPTAVPERAPARTEPLARRTPEPWEEGPEVPGLLKRGPGVEAPVPLEFPAYSYPEAARGTGLKAEVRLALLVDEKGRVIEARVREGAPPDLGFAETALAVARRIPFQPASRYDIPGKMWTEVILEFVEEETLERHRSR